MLNKKEVLYTALTAIVLSISLSVFAGLNIFLYSLLSVTLILFINIFAKKIEIDALMNYMVKYADIRYEAGRSVGYSFGYISGYSSGVVAGKKEGRNEAYDQMK